MAKSATRHRKQPQRRPAQPSERARRLLSQSPAPHYVESRVDSDAGEEAREEGDRDDDRDGDGPGDHSPWAGQVHGSAVRESTARRAQVPELLEAVLVGRKQVMRAERALTKRVGAARANGATWEDIGLAMGMSRQGAAKRFGSSAR